MVNKANMRLVVAALRSGRFVQGHGLLKQINPETRESKHCCLGVACEVAMENGVRLTTKEFCVDEMTSGISFNENVAVLPSVVSTWMGLLRHETNPVVMRDPFGDPILRAIRANDRQAWDFDRIADGLERSYGLMQTGGDDDVGVADTPATD